MLTLWHFLSFCQFNEVIFKDKKGSELLSLIVGQYKTTTVLSYNDARNQLWANMAKRNNDSLKCVYSGYTIYLNPNSSDPKGDAYSKDIDCEHTWPQSLGAEGDAKSDMHHLFPTWTNANSGRGNLAFKEIPDNETDIWYRNKKTITTIPVNNITEYSEKDNNGWFEPREDHKGNVARALVYFYTMYKSQADQSFWSKQINTLYQWHYLDPVDAAEWARNDFIASKQGGKKNPFIVDSTLFRRAYFPQYKDTVSSSLAESQNTICVSVSNGFLSIKLIDNNPVLDLAIYNINGLMIYQKCFNQNHFYVSLNEFPEGFLIYKIRSNENVKSGIIINRFSN